MSLATALLTPILGDASPWTPRRLFQLGEAGAVYDPSDLTAEKVAWRRNLLTWSQEFDNSAWTKTDTTITANSIAAPDGTLTADLATEGTAGNARTGSATVTLPASTTVAASFFLKRGNTDWVRIFVSYAAFGSANGAGAWFNLATGQKGTTAALGDADQVSSVIADAGNGWYRCTLISRSISTANVLASVNSASADGSAVRVNNATFYPWGAQLEVGSTATAYQRITDFTSDFLAAFPTHGLYQDAAGTTPVTALGQPVGLALDTSRGALGNLGPELVTNGDFSSGTGWTLENGFVISGGQLTYTAGTGREAYTTINTVAGRSYRVQLTFTAATVGLGFYSIESANITTVAAYQTAPSVYNYIFVATGATAVLRIRTASASGSATITRLSAREFSGTHAIQPTSASRPALDARVNLLTYSEQFDNAAWTKSATVTANTTVAPDGTLTADTFTDSSAVSFLDVRNLTAVTMVANSRYVASCFILKTTGVITNYPSVSLLYSGVASRAAYAILNTTTGTAVVDPSSSAASVQVGVEDAGAYWRLSIAATDNGGNNEARIVLYPAISSNGTSISAAATGSAVFWGADLRLATDAAYPYQRVVTATDYADVGVPRSFLFDGFDDSLYTASNMDLSGTDKVTVLAGVRKLSDAALGMALELGDRNNVRPGSFSFAAPNSAAANYSTTLEGSDTTGWISSSFAAPISNVYAALLNIGGSARVDEVVPRINGTVVQSVGTSSASAGTGNFGSYVLFIGRRNNTSLPFNGKAYQIIVRGALTDAATLAQAERYVGAKTGLYL